MKKIVIILLVITSLVKLNLFGQSNSDTVYFDKLWYETTKLNAQYFRLYVDKDEKFEVRDYYLNGNLQMLGYFTSFHPENKQGLFKYYDSLGNITSIGNFEKNLKDGDWTYFKNKNVTSKGAYTKGDKVGVWTYYYENKVIKSTGEYLNGNKKGIWTYYFENKKIEGKGSYTNEGKKTGLWSYFFENGNLQSEYYYENGKAQGVCNSYDMNGNRLIKKVFENGKILSTYYVDESGNEKKISTLTDEAFAEFPGGLSELYVFLNKNIRYPVAAISNNLKGKVYVYFIIDKKGKILYPRIYNSVHPLLDKEALRVVKSMPKWSIIEGKNQNNNYTSFILPINFAID